MRLRPALAVLAAAALTLTACSAPATESDGTDRTFDVSGVKKVDAIAALVPAKVRDTGKLVIGASADYAPAEFRAEDLKTYIGYDVDLGKALGKVLGLEAELQDAEFASLIPAIGSKYDIGISSFTIRPDRLEAVNMISYITVGSSYAAKKGNPDGFNPDDVCGKSIAVQTGTFQEEELAGFSKACTDSGKAAVEILSYSRQSDATTNVVGGKAVAFYADSPVASYASALTGGQLEVVGGIRDAAPQGIVVSKADQELTDAIQQAMQHLMDDGTWKSILDSWGIQDAALTTAELNPEV